MLLDVFVLPVASRMLDSENDDIIGRLIEAVVDEVGIFSSYKFAHAFNRLPPAKLRKQNEILQ